MRYATSNLQITGEKERNEIVDQINQTATDSNRERNKSAKETN